MHDGVQDRKLRCKSMEVDNKSCTSCKSVICCVRSQEDLHGCTPLSAIRKRGDAHEQY